MLIKLYIHLLKYLLIRLDDILLDLLAELLLGVFELGGLVFKEICVIGQLEADTVVATQQMILLRVELPDSGLEIALRRECLRIGCQTI